VKKFLNRYMNYLAGLRERALAFSRQSKHSDFIDFHALKIASRMLGHKVEPNAEVRELADDLIANSYRRNVVFQD
jgi:hypothetical protein